MAAFWIVFCAATRLPAQNWPEFRGPHGDGHADVKTAPTKWSETENIAWKTPLDGKAWASPVVWGKQIWLANAPADGKSMTRNASISTPARSRTTSICGTWPSRSSVTR
ncbi:MAG: hypothetical protein QM811_08225 [Pirellulales bacterium]